LPNRWGDGEVVDLHSEVSKPLTVHVFSEMFGIPEADRGWLAEAVIDVVVAPEAVSEDLLTVADVQSARVEEYLLELIAERRRAPQEDLISALVGTHVEDPEQLTDDELIAMLWVLWLAGFETTAMGIDNGVRALLDQPSRCGSLHGDDAQAHAFVDEVLRYDGVLLFGVLPRIATRDMEFSGATVSAGSDVRIVFAGANRDPAVFAEPDRFDPSRDTSAGLAFGHGMRYCLGPALSRLEMAVCLSGIHTRFPTLVAAGEPTWNDIVLQRAMKRFPVALDTSTRTRC
jgi:cytochrome P450 family 114